MKALHEFFGRRIARSTRRTRHIGPRAFFRNQASLKLEEIDPRQCLASGNRSAARPHSPPRGSTCPTLLSRRCAERQFLCRVGGLQRDGLSHGNAPGGAITFSSASWTSRPPMGNPLRRRPALLPAVVPRLSLVPFRIGAVARLHRPLSVWGAASVRWACREVSCVLLVEACPLRKNRRLDSRSREFQAVPPCCFFLSVDRPRTIY